MSNFKNHNFININSNQLNSRLQQIKILASINPDIVITSNDPTMVCIQIISKDYCELVDLTAVNAKATLSVIYIKLLGATPACLANMSKIRHFRQDSQALANVLNG